MKTVVLIEDNEQVATIFKIVVYKLHYNFEWYSNPIEAIKSTSINTANLIISDFDMFPYTALDLFKYFDKNNINKKVIINSGNLQAESIIQKNGFTKYVTAYINKMLSVVEIKNCILTYIN